VEPGSIPATWLGPSVRAKGQMGGVVTLHGRSPHCPLFTPIRLSLPCFPRGMSASGVVPSRLGPGSSTKTAGGSLAGKDIIEASSIRRSRRFRRSSGDRDSLIRPASTLVTMGP
jgi:hypothetical protein